MLTVSVPLCRLRGTGAALRTIGALAGDASVVRNHSRSRHSSRNSIGIGSGSGRAHSSRGLCTDGTSTTYAPWSAHDELPSHARVVVVGGGIIGSSIAYHLGKLGWGSDTVLLERDQLTSGTTWHAAGLMVTFGSTSETSTDFRKYTKELYSSVLEAETGQSTGFSPCGFIELATNEDRLEEYRRVAAFNRRCGVDVREITPEEVRQLFPLCRVDDVLAGFLVEDDGRVNPVDATMALAKGARAGGVTMAEGVRVTGVRTQPVERAVGYVAGSAPRRVCSHPSCCPFSCSRTHCARRGSAG